MSETPNEIVTRWLDEGSAVLTTPPEIREAIRAVLEDLRLRDIDCGCNNRVTRLEAERGTLRARLGEYALALTQEANLRRDAEAGCAAAWREVNLARAARDTLRAEVAVWRAKEEHQHACEVKSRARADKAEAERDAMRAERRSLLEQLARKDAERNELRAEVVRLRMAVGLADPGLLLLAATTRAKAAEAERDALMDDVQSTGKLWHEAESRAEKAEVALRGLYGALDKAFIAAYLSGSACDAIDAGLAALRGTVPRYAPGMNATDHKPHCDILTTRDGWDADCTCGWRDTAPRRSSHDA